MGFPVRATEPASLLAVAAKTFRLLGLFSCKVDDIRQSAVAFARVGHIWLLFLWPFSLVRLTLSSTAILHLILKILSLLYHPQTFSTLYSTDVHHFILNIYSALSPPQIFSTLSSRDIHHFVLHKCYPPYPLPPCTLPCRAGAFSVAPVSPSNQPLGHGLRQQSLRPLILSCHAGREISRGAGQSAD